MTAAEDENVTVFRSVKARRVSEVIVKQIQDAIFSGKWQPGDKLPSEKDLVKQFEASRGTVREAIRTLELSGLVTVRPGAGGGASVVEPTFRLVSGGLQTLMRLNQFSVEEVFAARLILEPAIAEMAAMNADEEDIRRLVESMAASKDIAEDSEARRAESYRFHFAIALASKSRLLSLLMSALFDVIRASESAGPPAAREPQIIFSAHDEIVAAI
ncbi:MAG: FadR family transcriptional regulator, partial [Chloroflexi bacterium]|nr:FadR family transcriptional regulator [Chloroflexota bacterium]